MPYEIIVPARYRRWWKIKIFDKERLEAAHVTIIFKTQRWRIDLQTLEFMDTSPPPKDVPQELVDLIMAKAETLRAEWNKRYPHNKVEGKG